MSSRKPTRRKIPPRVEPPAESISDLKSTAPDLEPPSIVGVNAKFAVNCNFAPRSSRTASDGTHLTDKCSLCTLTGVDHVTRAWQTAECVVDHDPATRQADDV